MLLVHHADHLHPLYLERYAGGNGSRNRQPKSHRSRNRLFSNEVACGKKRDGSLFTRRRNDR